MKERAAAWLRWAEEVLRIPRIEERLRAILLRFPWGADSCALSTLMGHPMSRWQSHLDRMEARGQVRRVYVVDTLCMRVAERDREAACARKRKEVTKLRRQGKIVRTAQEDRRLWLLDEYVPRTL